MNVELALTAAPLVVGLVEVAKMSGLAARWAGLAAIMLGMVVVALLGDTISRDVVAAGIAAGLMAAGLYSQATRIIPPKGGPGDGDPT